MDTDGLIAIGQIVGAHGVEGEVRVYPLTDFPERFASTEWVYLGGSDARADIEWAKEHKNIVIVKIKSVDDRIKAERLRGTYLYVSETDTVSLPEDTFYTWKLVGCQLQDEDGMPLGSVTNVLTGSGNDLLVVDTGGKQLAYIPFVREFIKQIDLETRSVKVRPIPGLLEP